MEIIFRRIPVTCVCVCVDGGGGMSGVCRGGGCRLSGRCAIMCGVLGLVIGMRMYGSRWVMLAVWGVAGGS